MRILKFYATWCGQCKTLTKEFKEHPIDIEIKDIDIEDNESLVDKYNIRHLPTVILEDNDEIIHTWRGFVTTEEINNKIKDYENHKTKL